MDRAPVTMSMVGPVAVVAVDDGADNTLDIDIINSPLSAFGTAQEQARAVVLTGRPGCYSAGLDIETLRSGGEAASDLLHGGTELILRLVEFPRPVVIACTGHALGAAAVSLLCCDVRIGSAGDYKIGLDWVSVGLPVPDLAVELARVRLSPRHMTRACNTAQMYSPDDAVEAGFLDSVTTEDAVEQACEVAADLAQRLDPRAFEVTRMTTVRWQRMPSCALRGICSGRSTPPSRLPSASTTSPPPAAPPESRRGYPLGLYGPPKMSSRSMIGRSKTS